MSEKAIRLASRLYDARDTAKRILGDGFADRMAKEQEHIRKVMEQHQCEPIPATMAIVTELQKKHPYTSGSAQLMILSACVELIEPTPTPCQT